MLCMVINTPSKYLNTCVELITTDIRVVVGWEDGSGKMGDEKEIVYLLKNSGEKKNSSLPYRV